MLERSPAVFPLTTSGRDDAHVDDPWGGADDKLSRDGGKDKVSRSVGSDCAKPRAEAPGPGARASNHRGNRFELPRRRGPKVAIGECGGYPWQHSSASIAVALVAPFVALGGKSYAAVRCEQTGVGSNHIKSGRDASHVFTYVRDGAPTVRGARARRRCHKRL